MKLNIIKNGDRYEFHRVDDDGGVWPLGHFSVNLAGDEYRGTYDTHEIAFYTAEDLARILGKYGQRAEDVHGLELVEDIG